jgi:hypothetical protein
MSPFPTSTNRAGALACGDCEEPFLVPDDCLPLDDGYVVELRCANCGREDLRVLADETIEEIDAALVRADAEIHATIELLELIDALEHIDRFTEALRDDLILPEDF